MRRRSKPPPNRRRPRRAWPIRPLRSWRRARSVAARRTNPNPGRRHAGLYCGGETVVRIIEHAAATGAIMPNDGELARLMQIVVAAYPWLQGAGDDAFDLHQFKIGFIGQGGFYRVRETRRDRFFTLGSARRGTARPRDSWRRVFGRVPRRRRRPCQARLAAAWPTFGGRL